MKSGLRWQSSAGMLGHVGGLLVPVFLLVLVSDPWLLTVSYGR